MEKDFLELQQAILQAGETHLIIVQKSQDFTDGEPMFRMKFPADISWQELTSGNFISSVLLELDYNEYYVFGATGKWGKYAATDYDFSMDIIGFKPDIFSVVKIVLR